MRTTLATAITLLMMLTMMGCPQVEREPTVTDPDAESEPHDPYGG